MLPPSYAHHAPYMWYAQSLIVLLSASAHAYIISTTSRQKSHNSPLTPTTSLIFAASPALSLPFIARKKCSQARSASSPCSNSVTQSACIFCQNTGSAIEAWKVADVISGWGPVGGAAISKFVNGIDVPGPSSTSVVMVNEGGAGLGGAEVDLSTGGGVVDVDDDGTSATLSAGVEGATAAALKYR